MARRVQCSIAQVILRGGAAPPVARGLYCAISTPLSFFFSCLYRRGGPFFF